MPDIKRKRLEPVFKLRDWIQKEFNVSCGEDLAILANLIADAILFTEEKVLRDTFEHNQSNRLCLRKLRSAFKLLKMLNLVKYEDTEDR